MCNSTSHSTTQIPLITLLLRSRDWIRQRTGTRSSALIDWHYLDQLEEGSLGQALVAHLQHHQLQPFASGPRQMQLHDTVHVLTGYGVDLLGELEVQAFLLGCEGRPAHIVLGLGLLHKIVWDQTLGSDPQTVWQRAYTAFQRGRQSSFDPRRWNPQEAWHLPLDQIRQDLGLTVVGVSA